MGKPIAILLSSAALAALATTSANAIPITSPVAPTSNVERVRLVCNEWGRCWRQPDYYRPYGSTIDAMTTTSGVTVIGIDTATMVHVGATVGVAVWRMTTSNEPPE
jgi:hypothetical protein